jgi:hypothetical protein
MRISHVLLASAALSAGGARVAAAECHKIFFTSLEVEDCKEFGVCDWKVECSINDQQKVTLVSNEEANTNESIAIDELLTTVQPFPFTVHCTVFEHDGGIGANWEDVMDETRTINGPGSFSMEGNNNEGTVDLHFNVDSGRGGGVGQTCDALSLGNTYDAVFRAGTGSQGVVYTGTWSSFLQQRTAHHAAGRRLEDIESTVENGVRKYTGVFRAGSGLDYLWAGTTWTSLMNKRAELAQQNYRLVDFESYLEGGTRVYTGVFLPGSGGHALWAEVSWNSLVNNITQASNDGLRLVDVESYMVGSVRKYTAVYLSGTGGQHFVHGLTWNAFVDFWEEMADTGYRLIDIESHMASGTRVYGGVFRPGNDGHGLWVGAGKSSMIDAIADFFGVGIRIVDLDVY